MHSLLVADIGSQDTRRKFARKNADCARPGTRNAALRMESTRGTNSLLEGEDEGATEDPL